MNRRVFFKHSELIHIHAIVYCLLFCLLIPQTVSAALWLDGYTGREEEYRLIRQNKELRVEEGAALEAGDELSVLSEIGELRILKENQEYGELILLTHKNGVFKVPESEALSSELRNLLKKIKKIIEEFFKSQAHLVSTGSRGSAPILVQGASSELKNHLLAELDFLQIQWEGGEPPYRVRLLDEHGNTIFEKKDIQLTNISLANVVLNVGCYKLEVLDNSSSSNITLAVVDSKEIPLLYNEIQGSSMPIKIKMRYIVMVLASQSQWLFQALQLAERYGMTDLKQNILNHDLHDGM